jgi:hypothetical protein
VTSTTGADALAFNNVTRLAQKFTAGTSGRLTRLDVNIYNIGTATGTVIVELWSNSSGEPSAMLARSSIASSDIAGSAAYVTARFAEAPTVTATTVYWIVVYVQATGTNSYAWTNTTSATTALTSADSGDTWVAHGSALNFKQYYATNSATLGLIRATKADGTKVTIFAHGTSVYSVNNVTGAVTAVKTGLSANATYYSFVVINDICYYCNGYDGLRKLSGTTFQTDAQVNATNYSQLVSHKGLLFGVRSDDKTRIDFSNFGVYETFTSTDFIYVPAPNTGDNIAAVESINGYLLIRTKNRCYILTGDDNATFRLDSAPDQKGTYTPLTTASDKNYTYFLSDDGVYRSNGTMPELISDNIYEEIRTLANKETCCMVINKGRLYLWHKSAGASANDRCYVWNLGLGKDTVESLDTDAFVSAAYSSFQDSDDLLVASSLVGQIFWQEKSSNDYHNLGGDIDFELDSHYMTFSQPAVEKQIRFWTARFGAQSGNYTVKCDYAYDQRDNWTTHEFVNVQGAGGVWGSVTWGSFTWGTAAETQMRSYIPGEYRRTAVRYKHYAARQPVSFLGHNFEAQIRRRR